MGGEVLIYVRSCYHENHLENYPGKLGDYTRNYTRKLDNHPRNFCDQNPTPIMPQWRHCY